MTGATAAAGSLPLSLGFERVRRRESGRGWRACATQPIFGFVPLLHPQRKTSRVFRQVQTRMTTAPSDFPSSLCADEVLGAIVPRSSPYHGQQLVTSFLLRTSHPAVITVRKRSPLSRQCQDAQENNSNKKETAPPLPPSPLSLPTAGTVERCTSQEHQNSSSLCLEIWACTRSKSIRTCFLPWRRLQLGRKAR